MNLKLVESESEKAKEATGGGGSRQKEKPVSTENPHIGNPEDGLELDRSAEEEEIDFPMYFSNPGVKYPVLPSVVSQGPGFTALQTGDLQGEYRAIQDSLVRQRLPNDLKFNNNQSGITSASKDTANAPATSAKYVESILKIVTNIQTGLSQSNRYSPWNDVEYLLVCALALMRFLQEDFCSLAVYGHYGTRAQSFYKSFRSGTSNLTPSMIKAVKIAATLASIPPEAPAGRERSFRSQNNRFRGGNNFRGRFRGRGGYQNNYDGNNTGFRP